MVGDPGIEPGVRLREGVTVPCHTLRPVAHVAPGAARAVASDSGAGVIGQPESGATCPPTAPASRTCNSPGQTA